MIPVTARYTVFAAPTGLSVIIEIEGDKQSIELKHSKSRAGGFKLSICDFYQLITEANRIKEFISLFTENLVPVGTDHGGNNSATDTSVDDSHTKDSGISFSHEAYATGDHDISFV